MWREEANRLALLELWDTGRLRRRKGSAEAWDELSRLPWTRRTSRRDELELVPERREQLEGLLDGCWPGWRAVGARLREEGLARDARGWRALRERERQAVLPSPLPERLNLRTATAAVGEHSKATLTEAHRDVLGDVRITRDGVVRLRASPGLRFERGGQVLSAEVIAGLFGEIILPERSLQDGTRLSGARPEALLTVENVGTYVDLSPPEGWLVAHVPGWNTHTFRVLLEQLGDVPVVHFGDLDPKGLLITRHLRAQRPGLLWAVPDFWSEYLERRGRRCTWPESLRLDGEPRMIQELAARGLWLEQEVITLDPRLTGALKSLV